jgi:ATP-binding cassette subfamily G (WHITE) protein 2
MMSNTVAATLLNAACISWDDVTVQTADGNSVLLRDVCGRVHGRMLAIMGASGAGKTTLMNLLACRLHGADQLRGTTLVDGRRYALHDLKHISGYVMQDDLLFPHLTVRETLHYAAMLRLPQSLPLAAKVARVDEVIAMLGLTRCAETRVGDDALRGISGGERKRLCVGVELLANPRLLFLDEPTSGLDSATALSLMETLCGLAHRGDCTVVCTIHQPQTRIFALFDDLLVLHRGQVLYHGPAADVLQHYAAAGFVCPEQTNPADYVIDVISAIDPEKAAVVEENAQKILAVQKQQQQRDDSVVDLEAAAKEGEIAPEFTTKKEEEEEEEREMMETMHQQKLSWIRQFGVLSIRSLKNTVRSRTTLLLQLLQTVVMAVLIGTVFLQIGTSQTSVVRRLPLLFFCVINQGIFGALLAVNSFPAERAIVRRERAAGTYLVSAYFVAKVTAETLVQLVYPLVFSAIVYWLTGLDPVASKFIVFVLFMELCNLAAFSLAIMVAALCRNVTIALSMLALVLEMSRIFGGFFLSPKNLPNYFTWLDALSYVKYSYVGIALNELTGLSLYCANGQLVDGKCPVTNGSQVIQTNGFDMYTVAECALVLVAMIAGFRVIAYLGMRLLKH